MSDGKIIALYGARYITENNDAEQEKVIGEIKYHMCLGVIQRLLACGKLSADVFDRADRMLRQKYLTEDIVF